MKGPLRLGAWLVCLALVGAGLYLAFFTPSPPPFERVDGPLHDVTVVPVDSDREHQLSLTGAPCGSYDYRESWAESVGLPVITDLNAREPVTVYTDPRSCAGFNGGGHGIVRALVWEGRLYATDAYLHPPGPLRDGLFAGVLLLLLGCAGAVLLIFRGLPPRGLPAG